MSGSLLSKTTGIDLLPLAYWKHPKLSKQSFFGGLLVVRDAGSNCFRRVGYFRSNDMDFKKMPTKPENLFFFMQENDNIVLIWETPSFGEKNFIPTLSSWLPLAFQL
jgi:hypothetical protein